MVVATKGAAVLRHAADDDLAAVDALTVESYRPIFESYRRDARRGLLRGRAARARAHVGGAQDRSRTGGSTTSIPDRLWVLDEDGDVFGFVSFWLLPEKSYGHIDNNGLRADRVGQGWATFMYRHVLDRFRQEGLRFAHVDTGLDDAHIPARRAYEAIGFDRQVPTVDYWQDLSLRNPGSTLA